MKNIYGLIFFLVFIFCYPQNIEKLKNANGFRDIKLGSNIKEYPNFVKKSKLNEEFFGAWGWNYDYILDQKNEKNLKKIGEAKIYRVFVKVDDNNVIYQISLVLDKNYDLLTMLDDAYGKPNFVNFDLGFKNWKTDNNIECELNGFSTKLETLYYFLTYTDITLKNNAQENEREYKRKKAISEF